MSSGVQAGGYVVPSYRAPDDTPWYHFLHGNVPGHQIDFMYRPEIPQGSLSRQHFSHLSRLMKYIEPQTDGSYAFAIGNLSRDDIQHEPGHGGVALMFGLRIRGATDHAGRQDPPFAHAVAAVDRELDYTTILKASLAFSRHVIVAAESAEWYRTYVSCAEVSPPDVEYILSSYVATFNDLPQPPWSATGLRWVTGGAPQPKRIVIVHEDNVPFERLADCAARIANMLYRSDIKWTSISNGREADVPNGVAIKLFAESSLSPSDAAEIVHRLDELPEGEAEIAEKLFGARSATEKKEERVLDWRERYAGAAAPAVDPGQRPSWEGRAYRPQQPIAEDPTRVWDRQAAAAASMDVDVPVDMAADEPQVRESKPAATAPQPVTPAPAPVMPARVTPAPAMPARMTPAPVTPAPVMPVPVKPATDAPVVSSPPASSAAADWAPSPNFRRPQAPMLKWTLIVMAIAGVVLAILYFAFVDGGTPGPGEVTSSSAETPPPPTPSLTATAPPAASTPAALPSSAPKATSTPTAEPTKGGSKPPKSTTKKSKSVFDAPLQLGK